MGCLVGYVSLLIPSPQDGPAGAVSCTAVMLADFRHLSMQDIFCYSGGRSWPMGVYGCLSYVFRSAQRHEGRGPQAFNVSRLFLCVCVELHKWNPDLLQYAVPADVREAEMAFNLTTSALTVMSKYQNRHSNEAAGTLYQFLRSYIEGRRA